MTVKVTEAAAADTGVSAASRARTELARLISYIVFGGVSVVLSSMAAGLPTSRWEPLGAGTFPKLVFALLAVLCLIAAVRSIIEIVRAGGLAGVGAAFTQWLYVRRVSIGLVCAVCGLSWRSAVDRVFACEFCLSADCAVDDCGCFATHGHAVHHRRPDFFGRVEPAVCRSFQCVLTARRSVRGLGGKV